MKYVPKGVSRLGGRALLKLNGASPTLLVVAGTVGLVGTAVLAAKATRNIDPVLDEHNKGRLFIEETVYESDRARQQDLVRLYTGTTLDLGKLYGPSIMVGTISVASVLYGHKILQGRHVATLAAYTGLMDQFQSYRGRVATTVGAELEKKIYEGAHGEYVEDPNHPGEYSLQAKYPDQMDTTYLTPWFDDTNENHTQDPIWNYQFLSGVQNHMNHMLESRGHVLLNDVLDQLKMPRCPEGQVSGWKRDAPNGGDTFIDFGFMTGSHPNTVAFRKGLARDVQLNFNIQGNVWV